MAVVLSAVNENWRSGRRPAPGAVFADWLDFLCRLGY